MRCFCTPRFSSSLQKRTFRQQGRLSRFRDASFLIPWGWAKTRAYGVYDDAVCAPRAYGVWLWCGSMGMRVPRVRMGILWCVDCVEMMPLLHRKASRVGYVFSYAKV